jgi:hypothetical protein
MGRSLGWRGVVATDEDGDVLERAHQRWIDKRKGGPRTSAHIADDIFLGVDAKLEGSVGSRFTGDGSLGVVDAG